MADARSADLGAVADEFLLIRPRLFGIAYRALGSIGDAEDIVQDVWAKWQTHDRGSVRGTTAFLVTMTTRLAINATRTVHGSHQRKLLSAFVSAAQVGDLAGLESLFASDVASYSDGGGAVRNASRIPVFGRSRVAKYVVAFAPRFWPGTRVDWIDASEGRRVLILAGNRHKSASRPVLVVQPSRRSGTAFVEQRSEIVKVVVIGGTGLIGSKLVTKLREQGHEAVPAAPSTGVNTVTGEGLEEALAGAAVVVDVSNSPSFTADAALEFFQTSTGNLLDCSAKQGVGHFVALSVVGTDRLSESGYFRAKIAQEKLIRESGQGYTIVHATQFFEFVTSIADAGTVGDTVHLAPVLIQPMASDDVAAVVGRIAVEEPLNGTHETGGPEQFRLDDLVRTGLAAQNDPREVVADEQAQYFGTHLDERTLMPEPDADRGDITFAEWLAQQ